ncbi:hypothetical protein WUBG_09680, partial [Wuchereria bancrofti]
MNKITEADLYLIRLYYRSSENIVINEKLLIGNSLAVYALVPFVPRYDETEAKILLNLTAGAYSTDPEKCVN